MLRQLLITQRGVLLNLVFQILFSVAMDPSLRQKNTSYFRNNGIFVHDTSSPEFAQSNGFVERMIQTLKNSLDKTFASDQDPYLALLTLITTPDGKGISPAYRLMNRQPRTVIRALCVQQQNQSNCSFSTKGC